MKERLIWEFTMIINPLVEISDEEKAKRKARIEQRRAKRSSNSPKAENKEMHDIDKPITLEDLTNPIKTNFNMKSFVKEDSLLKTRDFTKKFKKRKKFKSKTKKNDCSVR